MNFLIALGFILLIFIVAPFVFVFIIKWSDFAMKLFFKKENTSKNDSKELKEAEEEIVVVKADRDYWKQKYTDTLKK